jgi:hypothetical protein
MRTQPVALTVESVSSRQRLATCRSWLVRRGLPFTVLSLWLCACSSDHGDLFGEIPTSLAASPAPMGDPDAALPSSNAPSSSDSPAPPSREQDAADLPLSGEGVGVLARVPPSGNGGAHAEPVTPVELNPRILTVSPADGASAVSNDVAVVVSFSVPMDRALTEGAYQSEAIPSSAVTFSWNEQSTELTITPNQALEYARGTGPDSVEASVYKYFISGSATDQTGRRLASPAEFSFSLLRQIDSSFLAVQQRDLTGNWRSDDTYGSGSCARDEVNVCAGDTRVGGGSEQYKAFISFDLSSLPTGIVRVSAARLNLEITGVSGNPFAGLGGLFLEHVSFDAIGPEAFLLAPISELGRIANAGSEGTVLGVDVLPAVEVDVQSRGLSQYRLQFLESNDGDRNADVVASAWDTQSLEVSYLIP